MNCRNRLFKVNNPFDTHSTEELFFQAVKESFEYHYNNCPDYKSIMQNLDFAPANLRGSDDLGKIPFLPTVFFKNHRMFSMPSYKMLVKATSSGTKGKFSIIGMEASALLCGFLMVWRIGNWRKLFSFKPVNYIVLGYQPHKDNQTAAAKTAFGATLFAPAISRTYALKYEKDGYAPDLEGVIDALERHSRSKFPVRLIGFPSYLYFVLKMMDERGFQYKLQKGSKVLLGGGWKQHFTEQVEKNILYHLVKKVLGIEESDIIEFFSAVEHPVLYCDCNNHHFHVPVYSRVIIRDVGTLQPLEKGQIGLINLITPMVKATPIVSVMTDDLGVLHDGSECGCGISSPFLEIIGRVGLKEIKTCAAGAEEQLKGVTL